MKTSPSCIRSVASEATALSLWSSARNQEGQPTVPSAGACGQRASSRTQASRSASAPNSARSRARDTASSRSQAATSGAGINELVGHVVAFSLLATTTTPWPLPPGCRVLLVSLDEYRHWFPGKRADLLAIALDPREGGVHVAAIEVKARRTDEADAASGALDQLTQTLTASRWAAYPVPGSIHTRMWLNRIAEAAYAVARESRFKLDAAELQALEAFRLGTGHSGMGGRRAGLRTQGQSLPQDLPERRLRRHRSYRPPQHPAHRAAPHCRHISSPGRAANSRDRSAAAAEHPRTATPRSKGQRRRLAAGKRLGWPGLSAASRQPGRWRLRGGGKTVGALGQSPPTSSPRQNRMESRRQRHQRARRAFLMRPSPRRSAR